MSNNESSNKSNTPSGVGQFGYKPNQRGYQPKGSNGSQNPPKPPTTGSNIVKKEK